ncbi:hypothetical protein L226DRAFT_539030, partial [Lentinus tigrinus ALCF2SS1-7]|uniref:uncharacterized protein n=1 Tax=Lentinus tigrinus ALCF2SS1-7 TaxID=1328758 RepID=UPI001165E115
MQPSPSRFASQHLLALHLPPFVLPTLAPFLRRQTTSSPGPGSPQFWNGMRLFDDV